KGITIKQVEEAFKKARTAGLKTLAHFIFGLEEDATHQNKLIDFCLSLDSDYASFNIAAPAWNTSFREHVISNGWLIEDGVEMDSSCSYPIWERASLKRRDVWDMRNNAVKKFYMRPGFILKYIKGIKTPYQLSSFLRDGINFLLNSEER
ncbi:hypothetical protein ACFL3J_01405, partial [Candidatus Omnitrophota bacterium]